MSTLDRLDVPPARRLRVALIGAGGIAAAIASYAKAQGTFAVVAVLSRSIEKDLTRWPRDLLVAERRTLIERRPDLVVECAGYAAVDEHVADVLQAGIDVVLASTGSLADPELLTRLLASTNAARLIVPAGALLGIDGLSAAARDSLASVRLTSIKPPHAWSGTPAADIIDLTGLAELCTFFSGTARYAAKLFPKNANVAATVALAGIGFDRTTVQLIADPRAIGNTHRIDAAGAFGRFSVEIEGNTLATNPRTSRLTALSIVRAIELEASPVVL